VGDHDQRGTARHGGPCACPCVPGYALIVAAFWLHLFAVKKVEGGTCLLRMILFSKHVHHGAHRTTTFPFITIPFPSVTVQNNNPEGQATCAVEPPIRSLTSMRPC